MLVWPPTLAVGGAQDDVGGPVAEDVHPARDRGTESLPKVAVLTKVTMVKLRVNRGIVKVDGLAGVGVEVTGNQVHAAGAGIGVVGIRGAGCTDQEALPAADVDACDRAEAGDQSWSG